MRLLVVDDQEAVAAIISRIAEQGGWKAFQTTTAVGLDRIIRNDQIDVLMIDYLIVPGSDTETGLTVTEDLRRAGHTLPVILFSGATQLIDEARAREAGVVQILGKPLSIRELRTSLNEASRHISAPLPGVGGE